MNPKRSLQALADAFQKHLADVQGQNCASSASGDAPEGASGGGAGRWLIWQGAGAYDLGEAALSLASTLSWALSAQRTFIVLPSASAQVAVQMVVEEKFIGGYDIPALQVVGWEGTWGFLVLSIVLTIMYFVPAPADFCAYASHCDHFEDAYDAFVQVRRREGRGGATPRGRGGARRRGRAVGSARTSASIQRRSRRGAAGRPAPLTQCPNPHPRRPQIGNNWQVGGALGLNIISIAFFNFFG